MSCFMQCVLLLAIVYIISASNVNNNNNVNDDPTSEADKKFNYLKQHIVAITRQTMLQQFFVEQRVRSEGQSGIKSVRQRRTGTKNYFTESHTGYSSCAIHDHANNIRTVGMGEFVGVLNGVEFSTRHNDYRLRMPHRTSSTLNDVEDLPFPDVPPEVLNKPTIQGQVDEMREWFKAWRDQNYRQRDYRKYFKPALCYLEGAWTNSGEKIEEPFGSDRHFIDANTWMELQDKVRYTAYTGSKSILENLSFLPTKIMGITNESVPVFAQWNYRILCVPLKRDIPLNRLRVVDDLSARMMSKYNIHRYLQSRSARFQLNRWDKKDFHDRPFADASFLDELMAEIPGKDNYQGRLYDEGIDNEVLNDDLTKKDVSRYHRWYRVTARDAMGTSKIHRGYNDDYMFAAMTTQPKIAGQRITKCKDPRKKDTCYSLEQKWSYAIPLEIIYMTPLSKWNPYNLKYLGVHNGKSAKMARQGGRYGDCDPAKNKELLGTTSKLYYQTPNEFYIGGQVGQTAADTSRGVTCVLDPNGVSRKVRSAGTRVFLPHIKDVGILRQRYPIYPVHGEGSSVWKELNAFKDIFMNDMEHMKYSKEEMEKEKNTKITELSMGMSQSTFTTQHTHTVVLTTSEVLQLKGNRDIYKQTSTANGHQHNLMIRWNGKHFFYKTCDGKAVCWDRHVKTFVINDNDN